jgi:heat shock protein HslJ
VPDSGEVAALALSAVLGFGACGPPDALEKADLVGPLWQLTLFQDGTSNPIAVPDPTRYTIRFGTDDRAAVMSDCNTCGGPYSLDGASFRMGPLVCTRAFCGATSLDPAFPSALEKGAGGLDGRPRPADIHGDGVTLAFTR